MAEVEQRLTDVESEQAKFRDDTDEILLSEIMERLQQITHTLETMSNKIEGIENQIKAQGRLLFLIVTGVVITLLLAIGGAAAVILLLERLLYAN